MFDFAWSELALIGVVALVAIGPKDMPVAIKAVATLVKKARRMAGEFQTHIDDLMKEADLSDLRSNFNDLRSMNLRSTVERAIDPDGSLRSTMSDMPYATAVDQVVGVRADHSIRDPAPYARGMGFVPPPDHLRPDLDHIPPFIPPACVTAERALRAAPAFIPPEHALSHAA